MIPIRMAKPDDLPLNQDDEIGQCRVAPEGINHVVKAGRAVEEISRRRFDPIALSGAQRFKTAAARLLFDGGDGAAEAVADIRIDGDAAENVDMGHSGDSSSSCSRSSSGRQSWQ